METYDGTSPRPRTVFGWLSLVLGVAAWLGPIAIIAASYVAVRRATAASGGIGAVAGGVPETVALAIVVALVAGFAAGVVAVVRGERARWPGLVGLTLSALPIALFVATLVLRSL